MAIPSLLSMAVDGSTLALYFSETIKGVLPSRNRFQVFVNGVRNFASAEATLTNGDTIRLALTTPIPAGATVTVSYLSVLPLFSAQAPPATSPVALPPVCRSAAT